jgi:peptidyl-prolyl cis-trans isomerase SurA
MKQLITFILLFFCFINTSTAAAKSEQSLDRIIAVVNKTAITQNELTEAMEKTTRQLLATHTPLPPKEMLKKQLLDQLINRTLQLDLAKQAGIQVTEAEITKAILSIAQKNNISLEKLYASVTEQGLNKAAYRHEIHDEIIIGRIEQQMIGNTIFISPQEVDNFMSSTAWLSYHGNKYHSKEEQRKQAQEVLFQRKYEEALQTWIAKLRSESFINTHPEN